MACVCCEASGDNVADSASRNASGDNVAEASGGPTALGKHGISTSFTAVHWIEGKPVRKPAAIVEALKRDPNALDNLYVPLGCGLTERRRSRSREKVSLPRWWQK